VKRIVLWVLSTLSTLVVLFGYHTSTSSTMATTNESTISGSLQGQGVAGTSATGATGATAGGSAPPTDSTGGSSGGSGAGRSGTSTVTGAAARTPYGPVQVQLEVTGSQITNVAILHYPDSDDRDIQINQYALPKLIQQTLDSQSGSVSMVSGATYTSQGYAESLQSALDRAGL
jgi:hypothetical protein